MLTPCASACVKLRAWCASITCNIKGNHSNEWFKPPRQRTHTTHNKIHIQLSGFDWANYKFESVCFVGCANETSDGSTSSTQSRRAKKKKSDGEGDDSVTAGEDENGGACSGWDAVQSELDSIITCALCLMAVWVFRSALCYLLEHVMKRPISDDLRFPAWEVVSSPFKSVDKRKHTLSSGPP